MYKKSPLVLKIRKILICNAFWNVIACKTIDGRRYISRRLGYYRRRLPASASVFWREKNRMEAGDIFNAVACRAIPPFLIISVSYQGKGFLNMAMFVSGHKDIPCLDSNILLYYMD